MGCLDPQLDKERTFELLRKKGATRAVLEFSGGHDEGYVSSITLTVILPDGDTAEVDHVVWYCGGYTMSDGPAFKYIPASVAANEDEELSDLLQGPIDEEFGSWGSVESTFGTLTWDVPTQTVKLDFEQDEPHRHQRYV